MISDLIATSYTSTSGDIATSLKLEPRYENSGEVMSIIAHRDADPQATRAAIQAAGITSFGSLENLVNAYGTLFRYLKDNYDDKTKLKKFWGYLATNVVFIQITTDVRSALKIFETINERGVGLNPMDLLKNLLFTNVSPSDFTRLKDEWKKITKPLEKAKEKPLRFLRYFLMANYKIEVERGDAERKDAVVREDEIYDWLTNKENAAICAYEEKPFEFVRKIIRNVNHYLAYTKGRGNDDQTNLPMDTLYRLTGGAFSLHYVMLLASSTFPKPLFDHFVTQLESFLFYYIFTKTPTKDLERNFSMWADELRPIGEEADPRKQRERLNTFVNDRFLTNMTTKELELSDALKRYTLYSMQKYRTQYLLAKLSQYVDMGYKGLKCPGSLKEYDGLQMEHILPDTPTKALLDEFTEKNPKIKYDDCKVRLGNLTLLEKPLNIIAGNDFFAGKKLKYERSSPYLTKSLVGLTAVGNHNSITRINDKLLAFKEWTPATIEQRQTMLINLVKEVWKITPIDVS